MKSAADSYPPSAPLDRVLLALAPDLPPKIARAVLDTTMKRERLEPGLPPSEAIPIVVEALERTLPMFIMDAERRRNCVLRLRKLMPAGVERPSPPHAPRAPSQLDPQEVPPPSGKRLAPGPLANAIEAARQAEPEADLVIVPIVAPQDISRACDEARAIAKRVGFGNLEQTKFATTVAELTRNIQLYAKSPGAAFGRGEIRLEVVRSPRHGVEVTATDEGPGIADVEAVMNTSYRSKTGMGMGLKGAKRLMDTFSIESRPGAGTRVVARRYAR